MTDAPGKLRSVLMGLGGCSLAAVLLLWLLARSSEEPPEASTTEHIAAGAGAIWHHLTQLQPRHLAGLLLCELVVQLSKGLKWTAILRTVHPVRYSSALRGVLVGAAATHLVPLRLDEVFRTAVVARREGIAPGTVFGTVIVDRIVEVFFLGCMLLLLAGLTDGLPAVTVDVAGRTVDVIQVASWTLAGGFLFVVILCLGLLRWERRVQEVLPESGLGPRIAQALGSLSVGLKSLPRGRNLALLLVGAVGEWGATIAFYLLVLGAAQVDAPPALSVMLALGNSVSYALPNLPGALGFFEVIQSGMLEAVGVFEESASARSAALALSAHAILMVPVTLVGLVVGLVEWRHRRVLDSEAE